VLVIIGARPRALGTVHKFFFYRARAADLEDAILDLERRVASRAPTLPEGRSLRDGVADKPR
jgi:hypothetical protein